MNWRKILLTVGLVALLLFFLFLSSQYSYKKEFEKALKIQRISQELFQKIAQKKIFYIINKGDNQKLEFKINPNSKSTVFSLLKNLSEKKNFEISYKIYPEMGVFVESIDNLKNGRDGKYWQYWVNGKLPMVAADKMAVKRGDILEWKFEKPQF